MDVSEFRDPVLKTFVELGGRPEGNGSARIMCPAHSGSRPCLMIRISDDGSRIIPYCHAGCEKAAIEAAFLRQNVDLAPAKVEGLRRTAEQAAAYRRMVDEEDARLELLKRDLSVEILEKFRREHWVTPSKYLSEKKGVDNLCGGILIESNTHVTDLVIPVSDIDGIIWSYQTINDEGFKSFVPGSRTKGLFHAAQPLKPAKNVYLSEGYATACSITKALQKIGIKDFSVLVCFSANNLVEVAKELKGRFQDKTYFICSDNDAAKAVNTGKAKAIDAALILGAKIFLPQFHGAQNGAN